MALRHFTAAFAVFLMFPVLTLAEQGIPCGPECEACMAEKWPSMALGLDGVPLNVSAAMRKNEIEIPKSIASDERNYQHYVERMTKRRAGCEADPTCNPGKPLDEIFRHYRQQQDEIMVSRRQSAKRNVEREWNAARRHRQQFCASAGNPPDTGFTDSLRKQMATE